MDSNYLGFFNILNNSNFFKIKDYFTHHLVQFMEKTENSHLKKNNPSNPKNIYSYRKKVMRNLASSIIDIMV